MRFSENMQYCLDDNMAPYKVNTIFVETNPKVPHLLQDVYFLVNLLCQGRSQDFSKGGHTVSNRMYSLRRVLLYCRLFVFLKEAYKGGGGGHGHPRTPLAKPLQVKICKCSIYMYVSLPIIIRQNTVFEFQNNTNWTLIYHAANFDPDPLRYTVCNWWIY